MGEVKPRVAFWSLSPIPGFMDRDGEKHAIGAKLARCRELAEDLREGPTAEMVRILEDELREKIRRLDRLDRE